MSTRVIAALLISALVVAQAASPNRNSDIERNISDEINTQIVGGSPATLGQFPYQISMVYGGHRCGGSIIDASTIVTAAHCTVNIQASGLRIRAGHINLQNPGSTIQERYVSRIINHPNYNSRTQINDISILKLSQPFTFNTNVNKIALPAQDSTVGVTVGNSDVASGWGSTREGGSVSNTLMYVSLPIVSQATCRSVYGSTKIKDTMVCAGYSEGGKDTCQGDSGGPLATSSSPQTLVGVTSFGNGCARRNAYGVYTRVASYTTWIRQNCSGC